MAVLAYLLLPVSGLAAYLRGRSPRTRGHGLQAIALGLLWPVLLYGAAFFSPVVTQAVFAAGLLAWLVLMAGTGLGRDPHLPWIGRRLFDAAAIPASGHEDANERGRSNRI